MNREKQENQTILFKKDGHRGLVSATRTVRNIDLYGRATSRGVITWKGKQWIVARQEVEKKIVQTSVDTGITLCLATRPSCRKPTIMERRGVATMVIKYPTWKVQGGPTPSEKLMICPKCEKASWNIHTSPPTTLVCNVCPNRERLREATPEEYVQGKKALKEIL